MKPTSVTTRSLPMAAAASFAAAGHAIGAIVIGAGLLLSGCSYMAIEMAPAKKATSIRSKEALAADAHFWDAFHGAKYDEIQPALEQMTAAYLKEPTDSVTASHDFAKRWVGNGKLLTSASEKKLAEPTRSIRDTCQ